MSTHPITASNRLALSRERLRVALRHGSPESTEKDVKAMAQGAGQKPSISWLNSLHAIPGIGVVIESLGSWWAHHPLRMVSLITADAARSIALPLAQRHPIGLVFGAFLLGAVLVSTRSWRWAFKPVLFAGLVPHLFSTAASHLPVRSWLAAFTSPRPKQHQPESPTSATKSTATHSST